MGSLGAVYNASKLKGGDSIFCENFSLHSGAIDNYGDLEIIKSEFKANMAKVCGGAMCKGRISITGPIFTNQYSKQICNAIDI